MNYLELASDVTKKAIKKGANESEVFLEISTEFQVRTRKGEIEILKQSQKSGLGLRVFVDNRLGFSYTSDFNFENLETLMEKTIVLAGHSSSDEFFGLPEKDALYNENIKDLKIYDPRVDTIDTETKIELAKRAEEACFSESSRIKNSEGANFISEKNTIIIANSISDPISFDSTYFYLSAEPIAENANEKRIGVFWDSKRFFSDLDSPENIGKKAALRAERMLGAKRIKSQKVPVILENIISNRFLYALASAVNGDNVYKKASFLASMLNKKVSTDLINLNDDGTISKGLNSRPFDDEGVLTRRKKIIDKGVLTSFLYDTYTATKAKTTSTGNASRGYDDTPHIGILNFYMENGETTLEQMIKGIKSGLLITDLMGFGINWVTGDFSQMAEGIWIENGELTYPVDEVTLAGTLFDLLAKVEQVGDDLVFRGPVACPSLKISEMVIGGK